LIPSLQHLSQPEPVYLAWWKGIEVTSRVSPRIDEVEIIGLKRVGPELVQRYLHATNGSTIRPTEINRDLLRMYGDGYYESVDYTVLTQRERNILRVTPIEKSWGPDYLRLALNLETSTNSPATFGLRAAYHKTLLNSLGAEFITSVDVGFTNRLLFDFYQPLDRAQRFFVSTAARRPAVAHGYLSKRPTNCELRDEGSGRGGLCRYEHRLARADSAGLA
jgi:NTE family protein